MSGRDPLSGTTPVDSTGAPYALATIDYYIVGTTTREDTYTTAALSVAHDNPITLGADGRIPEIFFSQTRMKRVFKDSSGNTISGLSWDGIDKSKQRIASASAPSPTYPGLEWVDTDDNTLYERNAANDGWINRGDVDSIGNTASITEVLTGTETAKYLTPDGLAALWQRGTNITPSGGTVTLPSTGGGVYNIAAGNFSAISTAQGGRPVLFVFSGVSVITHDAASMRLPGAANITTAANDVAVFVNEAAQDASGTNWACAYFSKYTGSPLNLTDFLASQAEAEAATSSTKVPTIARMQHHPGVAKARCMYDQSSGTATVGTNSVSYNISSLTDGSTGIATPNFTTAFATANYHPSGVCQRPGTNNDAVFSIQHAGAASPSTTACPLATTVAAVATDMSYVSFVAHGDQA